MTNKKIIGYKAFDKDLKCKDYQYEIGKIFIFEGEIEICRRGFHYSKNIKDVLNYYPITSRFCKIEDLSNNTQTIDDKSCTDKIKIVKELSREELVKLFKKENYGIDNIGLNNLGYRNTGDQNTGDQNTGYRNTGDYNTGNWNKCDYETGFFNSKTSEYINVFNKPCKREDFINAEKPSFIYDVNPNKWVYFSNMNKKEKKENPNAEIQDGYLKNISMKEAWANAFKNATNKDIELLKALPNYDYEVFSEITGIKDDRLKIEI